MREATKIFLTGFLLLFFCASMGYAQGASPMYNFYNGLAAVIEQNMASPEACVAEAGEFIKNNIGPIQEAMERGMQMAKSQQNRQMNAEETQMMNQGMDAVNRFMQALQAFAMQYPEHAERITEILSQYAPQEEGEY